MVCVWSYILIKMALVLADQNKYAQHFLNYWFVLHTIEFLLLMIHYREYQAVYGVHWYIVARKILMIQWTENITILKNMSYFHLSALLRNITEYSKLREELSKTGIEFTAWITYLTHWGQDKMAAISQTTFSNAFSWMKICRFRLRFHWSLFLWVQLIISQYWFR